MRICFSWVLISICLFATSQQAGAQFTFVNVGHAPNPKPGYGYARSVALSGNHAIVANGSDALRIYDVSNPDSPVPVGHSTNQNFGASSVAVTGNYAYVAGYP